VTRREAVNRRTVLTGGCVVVAAAMTGCSRYEPPAEAGPQTLGPTADVPVGGGTVFTAQKVVVTQPNAGVFQAFSAVCTHQGCTVNEVVDGTINCPCHGSKYSAADGSVVTGPAQLRLPRREVAVEGAFLKLL